MSFINVAIGVTALTSAASAIFQGQAAEAEAEYNAKSQELEAENEMAEQREAAKRQRAEHKAILARQLAIRAGQGVDVASGSSLLVQAETAARLELEVQEQARVSSNRVRALQSGAQASRIQGKNAKRASYFQAGASLIQGGFGIAANVTRATQLKTPSFNAGAKASITNASALPTNSTPLTPSGRVLTTTAYA